MKGICFKETLFHATIEGRKTQTRRLMDPQPTDIRSIAQDFAGHPGYEISEKPWTPAPAYHFLMSDGKFLHPRYKVGDIVYLKEPYAVEYLDESPRGRFRISYKFGGDDRFVYVDSDEIGYDDYEKIRESMKKSKDGYANKLYMPGWAARYFIKIITVRAERLQDISDEDCFKEGIWMAENVGRKGVSYWYGGCINSPHTTPQQAYAALIDKINGRGTWEGNPWVWVYDYELYNKKTNQ